MDGAQGKLTLDRRLALPPLTIGSRTLQPVARLAGWRGGVADNWAGAWLRVVPVEVIVRERDGSEQRLRLVDGTATALRAMIGVALLVALLSWVARRAWS